MGLLSATTKAATTRRGLALLAVLAIAVIVVSLWFFVDGFADDTVAYLNDHGGYASLIVAGIAALSFIAAFVAKKTDPYVMGISVVLAFAAVAILLLPMTIGAA